MQSSVHCCDQMTRYLEDGRIPISYSSRFREYNIPLKGTRIVFQGIFYCPWCGIKLPESLRDKFFEILEEQYGIDPFSDEGERLMLPEFKTDEWWKKRGL